MAGEPLEVQVSVEDEDPLVNTKSSMVGGAVVKDMVLANSTGADPGISRGGGGGEGVATVVVRVGPALLECMVYTYFVSCKAQWGGGGGGGGACSPRNLCSGIESRAICMKPNSSQFKSSYAFT